MRRTDLQGKRVVILGYGREGQASYQALVEFVGEHALSVWTESTLPLGTDVKKAASARVIQDRPFDEGLSEFDVAIRSPGIPIRHPALMAYEKKGGRIVNPSSIYLAERPETPLIGITGSKGKSTTASMLAHMLATSGRSVILAGNIGRPLIGCLELACELVIAELSSYQLCDLEGSVELGVITRLFPEHVDWHGSVEAYYGAKLRLFDLAKRGVLIQQRDPILMEATQHAPNVRLANPWPDQAHESLHRDADVLVDSAKRLFSSEQWTLKGQHNLDNAVLALSVFQHLGGVWPDAVRALSSFQPLKHRLQVFGTTQKAGITIQWVNDSIATTPHATRAALEALAGTPMVLLVGGYERGGDWSVIVDRLRDYPLMGLVALPDNGPSIAASLVDAGVIDAGQVAYADNLDQAVRQAESLLRKHISSVSSQGMVLLSPGAPSFGHYRDFEARGDRFMAAVADWATESSR